VAQLTRTVSPLARVQRAQFTFTQYHNQTATSALHARLVELWDAVATETGGRVMTTVFAENNKVAGSDPAALKMLVSGDIQFFTLMGGILGNVVPVAEVQQVPFAFRSAAQAHAAMDGRLGAYLRAEMAANGIHGFPVGAFDNGIRQIGGVKHPIRVPADLAGLRMRVPAGQIFSDMFKALGAEPVTVNSADIYAAFKAGTIDAQENPPALVEQFKLYEVMKYISLTNHMWSGFNMLAHQPTWMELPSEVRAIVERNVTKYVRLQRRDQERENVSVRSSLQAHGLVFNDVDTAPFKKQLAAFYVDWKNRLGTKCWSLLQNATGSRLG
jgi:tripartite ATP-independent transporter DctP family solute receptor